MEVEVVGEVAVMVAMAARHLHPEVDGVLEHVRRRRSELLPLRRQLGEHALAQRLLLLHRLLFEPLLQMWGMWGVRYGVT